MSDEDAINGSKAGLRNGSSSASATINIADQNVNFNKTAAKDGKKSDKDCKSRHNSGESGNSSEFDFIEVEAVNEARVAQVMAELRKHHYSPVRVEDHLGIQGECAHLFKKDYIIETVDNRTGRLSFNYPQELIIPVGGKDDKIENVEFNKMLYIALVKIAFAARSRARFIVPVILFDDKFICRSGTVGNLATTAYETAVQSEPPRTQYVEESILQTGQRIVSDLINAALNKAWSMYEAIKLLSPDGMETLLMLDAELMRCLKVEHICDLMVENSKKVIQNTVPVSSSEKVNQKIYKDFKIEQMPYPGCEFFEKYHEANRKAEGLIPSWKKSEVEVVFKLSEDHTETFPGIEWEKFKKWDLIQLTQVYMKVLLTFIARDSCGITVHCISGWDRTPVFVSLLRVSLWADGVVHESLNTAEMAYLTLAYDWYLFGHNFPVRYGKKEEIMHFCLNFMQHMASDDFSIQRIFHELPPEQKNREFPASNADARRKKLTEICSLLLRLYEDEVIKAPNVTIPETSDDSFEEINMPSEG